MGNVEKRGKNSWRVGEQVNGEWIRRTVKFSEEWTEARQRKAAEVELAKLIVDIDAGIAVPSKKMTVRKFSEMYMNEYITPDTSENHRSTSQHYLDKHILPKLGDIRLDHLTSMEITKFLNELKVTPRSTSRKEKRKTQPSPAELKRYAVPSGEIKVLSVNTVYHYYQFLKAMLTKAMKWGMLANNPIEKVDPPKKKKPKPGYLTEDQAIDFLRKISQEDRREVRAAFLLALLCGLRLGEVGALRLTDIDWEKRTIDIARASKYTPKRGSFEGAPKSEAGARLITLPDGIMPVLEEIKDYQETTAAQIGDRWHGYGVIVSDWDGSPFHHDTPSKWFRDFADANGFDGVTFQQLRHTHATLLLANNIDVVSVANRLGHGDAKVTLQVYAHALRKRDEDAANAMQRIIDIAQAPEAE